MLLSLKESSWYKDLVQGEGGSAQITKYKKNIFPFFFQQYVNHQPNKSEKVDSKMKKGLCLLCLLISQILCIFWPTQPQLFENIWSRIYHEWFMPVKQITNMSSFFGSSSQRKSSWLHKIRVESA